MVRDVLTKEIDRAAVMWEGTRDPKYKELWYKLVKEIHGTNYFKREFVSTNSSYKTDDGWNSFDKRR